MTKFRTQIIDRSGSGIGESSTAGTADERDSASLTGSAWPPTAAMMAAATSAKLALAIAEGSSRPATPRCFAAPATSSAALIESRFRSSSNRASSEIDSRGNPVCCAARSSKSDSSPSESFRGVMGGDDRHHFDDRLSR